MSKIDKAELDYMIILVKKYAGLEGLIALSEVMAGNVMSRR